MSNKRLKDELIDSEIPFISVMNELHIEIFSDKKILIEGAGFLEEYQNTLICLRFKKGNLIINGDSLSISSVNGDGIIISGKINSINFERQ